MMNGNHPSGCPCSTCEVKRELETFVAIREIHQQGDIPWQFFAPGASPPKRGPVLEENAELVKQATLMGLAASGLPKKRGAKKKHTDRELLELMLAVDSLLATEPQKSDKEAIEAFLRNCYKQQGKRTSRVMSLEIQASIKTILNLLGTARKRFGKPRRT